MRTGSLRRPRVALVLGWAGLLVASTACSSRRGAHDSAPVSTAGCAAPRCDSRAAIEAGFARSKQATPHIPMMSEEATHEALPAMFVGRDMPYLMRVGGLQPKTMTALMAFAKEMRTEGDLDRALLDDVFWVVSHVNECLY